MKPSNIQDYRIYTTENIKDYYSQRNNVYDPRNTCNVTSMIKACTAMSKYVLPEVYDNKGNRIAQPEDRLYYICNHNEMVLNYYKEKYPELYNDYINKKGDYFNPNEVHDVLSYATNIFLDMNPNNHKYKKGDKYTYFSTNTPIALITLDIFNRKPVVISGKFNGLNHVITVVGYAVKNGVTNDENYYIVHDPYGETYNYKNFDGHDVWLSQKQFINDIKPLGDKTVKWAHRFC